MILIYGKGKVGMAVADLCVSLQIEHEIKDDSDELDYSRYDFIIPSPGIPSSHNVYKSGKVKSELDFAYEFLPKSFHIVAVTGTDGKSTTSWILYELLRQEFGVEKVYLSGNFEIPFSQTVNEILKKNQKRGYIVLEVSSFMAYLLSSFKADYSVFTNFKPDHLNWHIHLQDYLDSKMNLLSRTKKVSILNSQVVLFANNNGLDIHVPLNSRIFSSELQMKGGLKDSTDGEEIIISGRKKYKLSETRFSGLHNASNILSATVVMNEMGICSKRVGGYLKNIQGLPHRIEFVTEKNGVSFIDDSKSTSCQSLMAALTAFNKKKLILIAGGSDKGDTFDGLEASLSEVSYSVLLGATKDILASKCEQAGVMYTKADSMLEAVQLAWSKSKHGDTILLSPGCASFGLFRDYLDRAEKFRDAIKKLP
ncbi:MAG: UDP-N-acetylmuramoyl-L-alanine--D-glutamate ligase [Candidatus Altimarinota bacterium]